MKRVDTIIKNMYQVIIDNKITNQYYIDESWENVRNIQDLLRRSIHSIGDEDGRDFSIFWTVNSGGYSEDGNTKEYRFNIYEGTKQLINGYLNCHAAGTMNSPFSKYDVSILMFNSKNCQ